MKFTAEVSVNVLFVHQSFPGQYVHQIRALAAQGGHRLVGLGIHPPNRQIPARVAYKQYTPRRGNAKGVQQWAVDYETKLIRGEACAAAAWELKQQGFKPDLICGHTGWGETLFLKDVFPDTPLLAYQEFFYNHDGFDTNFDHEFSRPASWETRARTRAKTAPQLMSLHAADWNVTPTRFQLSSFPASARERMSVIHDGIDISRIENVPRDRALHLSKDLILEPNQKVITFVNRRIEPYRGCHTFLRAVPAIHSQHPDAHVVVVGALKGVSYGSRCPDGEWADYFLREIEGAYAPNRLHLVGNIPYESFLHLLRLSKAHVYLTYPFVLSWSMLEAMAAGCAIIGSRTAPVEEVIKHGENGLLVDFFSPQQVAEAIDEVIANPDYARQLGDQAKADVAKQYSLDECLARHLALQQLVSSRSLFSRQR